MEISDGYITYVQIPLQLIDSVEVILAENTKETVGSMKKKAGVDYIINGGFFWTSAEVKWKNYSVNNLISQGKPVVVDSNYSNRGLYQDKDKNIAIGPLKATEDYYSFIGGSPNLITDGNLDIDHSIGHGNQRHPRSAVGITEDSLILLTADGRQLNKPGITLTDLANYMIKLGCTDAINLDGGGSTRLESRSKVLNSPVQDRLIHNSLGITLTT